MGSRSLGRRIGGETTSNSKIDESGNRISKRTGKPVRHYKSTPQNALIHTETIHGKVEVPRSEAYISHMLEVQQVSMRADVNDVESLKACFLDYLGLCAKNGMKVGNFGAYAAMGITKTVAYDWEHGRSKNGDPRYKKLIQFVKSFIATYRECAIAEGEINPIVGIFWQKSFDGLNEMAEVEASEAENSVSDRSDAKQIAEKYQGLLPE